ncbi:MAG: AsmA family protein, partial [Rhodovibrionaceae bacterium]|nr:AsmA family protein [Rhodovibrionaceae bacterium]
MRFVIFAVLLLIAFIAAAIVVGPELIDWNDYKPQIAKRIEQATGRSVSIDGDVSLKLLPTPAFSAEDVSVANFQEGTRPEMLTLESLRVRVALLPLLKSELQVRAVELRQPIIFLEVLPGGRRNWDFGSEPESGQTEPTGAGQQVPAGDDGGAGIFSQVRLDSFVVVDGTLIYRDSRSSFEERIEDIDARIAAESLEGPFAMDGDAVLRGVPTAFDLAVGRIARGGAAPVNLTFSLPDTKAQANLSGTISIHAGETAFRGKLRAEAVELAAAVARLTGGPAPVMLSQPFKLDVTFQGSAKDEQATIAAKEIRATIGETSLTGKGQYATGQPAQANLDLQLTRISLDDWLAAARQERAQPAKSQNGNETAGRDGASEEPLAGFTLPDDIDAQVDVSVQAVVYRQQVVRQIGLRLGLSQGELRLERALALLPGGSDISLTGGFSLAEDQPAFQGRLEAASNNLRSLLSWLGVAVEGVRADRLRRMNLLTDVEATPQQLTLRNIKLDVDVSQISGGVAVALRKRLGIGAGLTIDKINLDGYLPASGVGFGGGDGGTQQDGGQASNTGDGAPGPLERLDANLDLRAGQVTWMGETARDLRLDATLNRGEMELRRLGFGDLSGVGGQVSGTLRSLGSDPVFALNLDFALAEPARFAQMVGADVALMRRLGEFALTGSVEGDMDLLTFADLRLKGAGGQATFEGAVQPLASPPAFDLQMGLSQMDLPEFVDRLAPGTRIDPAFDKLELAGRLNGTVQSIRLDDLVGRLGPTALNGDLGLDLGAARPRINANLETGELPLALLAGAAAAGGDAKATASAGGSSGSGERWSREEIDLSTVEAVDGEVALRSAALVYEKHRLENATLAASLNAGRLEINALGGDFNGGRLDASGALDARGTARIDLDFDAREVNVDGLAPEVPLFGPVSGPVSITGQLSTAGRSEAEMIGALSGRGTVEGDLKTEAGEQVGTGV